MDFTAKNADLIQREAQVQQSVKELEEAHKEVNILKKRIEEQEKENNEAIVCDISFPLNILCFESALEQREHEVKQRSIELDHKGAAMKQKKRELLLWKINLERPKDSECVKLDTCEDIRNITKI